MPTSSLPPVGPQKRNFRLHWITVALLLGWISISAQAQITSTWNGGAGNWSDCPPSGNALWDTCNANPPTFPNGNYDAVINGGPVTMTSAGIVNLSLGSGGSLVFAQGTTGILTLTGTSIANNGTISIASGDGFGIQGPGSVTISGSGSISIAGSRFTGSSTPTVTLQQPLSGNGAFSLGMNLVNQSTINATGGTLTMQPTSVVNTGTFEASSGGILSLNPGFSVNFNNAGGIIQALNGGIVQLDNCVCTGGTLTTTGTGVNQIAFNTVLNSLTNTGTVQVPSGNSAALEGTVTNNSVIQVPSATLGMSGNVTLAGSGNLLMSGTATLNKFTGSDTLTSQQLIHGSGRLFELPFTNQNTLSADSSGNSLTLSGGTTTNNGTMQATGGGTLELDTVVDNTGGIIEALAGSTVIFTNNFNGSINGGTLTTSGTGVIESENGVLDGTVNIPTNAGKMIAKGFDLFIQGTVNNTGTITLSGKSCMILNQPSTLTGAGKVVMASTTCIFGSGNAFTNQSTILGAGTIGDSNPMPITNTGMILANQASPLIINSGTFGFTNSGKLNANAGSTLTIQGVFNTLSNTGTLSGGTYSLAGTLGVPGSIVTNAGNITLTGTKAEILNTGTSTNALAGLTSNATTGLLTIQGGQALSTGSNLTNSGKVTVATGSSLTLGGSYTQASGTTAVDGTLSAPSGMSLTKGSLVGKGTIAAAVTSNASITAGDAVTKPGKLTITGSYTQQSKGILTTPIGGTAVGTFGELAVSNGVSLSGTLAIKLANGFVPVVGDTFPIVTASALSGQFATVTGTSINSSEHFQVAYSSTGVTLEVVSGP